VTLALFAVAACALVVFVVAEHLQDQPMLDLALLSNPSFATLLATAALLPASAWAFLSYQTLWLQSVLGLSAVQAGLVMLPASLTTFCVSIVVGRAMHRTSPRLLVGTGMLLIAAGAFAETIVTEHSGWGVAVPGLFLVGLGAGLALGPLSAAAMAAVPTARAGMAGGAVNTFRQLGYALGVAVLGAVFGHGLDGPTARQAYAAALDQVYVVAAAFGLVAGVAMFAFARPARSE
jgi:predicted MFS family arabinose efflux permease